MHIRPLTPADASVFRELRLHGLQEAPTAFGSSYEDEVGTPLSVTAGNLDPESGRVMFGAFVDETLVGLLGLGRETACNLRHKAFIVAMYVHPRFRKRGIASGLLQRALQHAPSLPGVRQVTLAVNASNAPALALYEKLGFRPYGQEPAALLVDRKFYDETLLVYFLTPPTSDQ